MAEQDLTYQFLFRENISSSEARQHGIKAILSYIREAHSKAIDHTSERTIFVLLVKKYISILKATDDSDIEELYIKYYEGLRELAEELDRKFSLGEYDATFSFELQGFASSSIPQLLDVLEQEIVAPIPGLETNNYQPQKAFSFYDLYSSTRVNKADAEELVKQAISIIENDASLTSEAKDKIIQHLKKALQYLSNNNVAGFYGVVTEVIIILGAIGSLVGGACAVIDQATENLQKATEVVQQSSIDIEQTYIIQGYCPEFLSGSSQRLLEGSSDISDLETNSEDEIESVPLTNDE